MPSKEFGMELNKILKLLEDRDTFSREFGREVTHRFIKGIKMSLVPKSANQQIVNSRRKANKHRADYQDLKVEYEKIEEENNKLRVLLSQRDVVILKLKQMVNAIGDTNSDQHMPLQIIVNLLEIALRGVTDVGDGDIEKIDIDKLELDKLMSPIERRLKNIGVGDVDA